MLHKLAAIGDLKWARVGGNGSGLVRTPRKSCTMRFACSAAYKQILLNSCFLEMKGLALCTIYGDLRAELIEVWDGLQPTGLEPLVNDGA